MTFWMYDIKRQKLHLFFFFFFFALFDCWVNGYVMSETNVRSGAIIVMDIFTLTQTWDTLVYANAGLCWGSAMLQLKMKSNAPHQFVFLFSSVFNIWVCALWKASPPQMLITTWTSVFLKQISSILLVVPFLQCPHSSLQMQVVKGWLLLCSYPCCDVINDTYLAVL